MVDHGNLPDITTSAVKGVNAGSNSAITLLYCIMA